MAKVHFANGDLDAAIETLRKGEHLGGEKFSRRLPLALRGEQLALYLRAGNIEEAKRLAEQSGFVGSPKNAVGVDAREISREIPRIAAYRLQIALGQTDLMLPAVTAHIKRTRSAGRTRKVIELLILKSKAAWIKGDEGIALRAFAEALSLGEPEGFFRVFVDEQTSAIRAIVIRMIESRLEVGHRDRISVSVDYLQRLANALGIGNDKLSLIDESANGHSCEHISLTKREIEILRYVDAGLSNRELASSLFVSVQTIKWHLYNTYSKLGVRNRTGAVAIARQMKLLD